MPDAALENVRLDSKDTRGEIHRLLERLSPRQRVAFVQACCEAAPMTPRCATVPGVSRATRELAESARVDSSADRRLALTLYFDLWLLATQYHFSLELALEKLERMVKKKGVSRGRGRSVGPVVSG
jgi:hypothetical protein